MKEDYLWDKTGADAEIEMLENALQAFRYKETAPPAVLPAKVVPFTQKSAPRKTFRFAAAIAACLMFCMLAFGVWFQVLRNNIENNQPVAEIKKTEKGVVSPDNKSAVEVAQVVRTDQFPVKKTETSQPASERKVIKIRQAYPVNTRLKQEKTQFAKTTAPEVQLTKEEKFAYDQLMLALSITSSKLKMVKDKVDGLDEKTTAVENNR